MAVSSFVACGGRELEVQLQIAREPRVTDGRGVDGACSQWRAMSRRRQIQTRSYDARIVEELAERARARRPAGQARVQAHRHDPRRRRPLGVELVERGLQVREEVVAGAEARRGGELRVVGVHRVGHDEVAAAADGDPVGQLVVVGVRVVEEAAFLDQQPPRVLARAVAAVPAERPLARWSRRSRRRPARCARAPRPRTGGRARPSASRGSRRRGPPRGSPAPPAGLRSSATRAAEHRQRQVAARELVEHAPDADAAAVLVERFEREVAPARGHPPADASASPSLGATVAVGDVDSEPSS